MRPTNLIFPDDGLVADVVFDVRLGVDPGNHAVENLPASWAQSMHTILHILATMGIRSGASLGKTCQK